MLFQGGIREYFLPSIIHLVSGAVGGNAAGALMKNLSLGALGNSIGVFLVVGLALNCLTCWK